MIGVELIKSLKTREPAVRETHEIAEKSFQKGILLLPCGENVIRFSPPLVISSEEIDVGLKIFSRVLDEY